MSSDAETFIWRGFARYFNKHRGSIVSVESEEEATKTAKSDENKKKKNEPKKSIRAGGAFSMSN